MRVGQIECDELRRSLNEKGMKAENDGEKVIFVA